MPDAIRICDIVKSFGPIQALRGLSFSVEAGSVFSLLGPNGAGKTTLLRILTTLARPTSGSGSVSGRDMVSESLEVRRLIGVVPQENNLDAYLTCRENMMIHARLHRMEPAMAKARIDELLELVGLTGRQHDFPTTYSGGMRRRLVLARALLHDPRVLFLDEPTTGLDPQSRRVVWDYLQSVRGRLTIFLTTHYMEEAERLADRVVILSEGRILADGTPPELKRSVAAERILEVSVRGDAARFRPALEARLGAGSVLEAAGSALRLAGDRPGWLAAVGAAIPDGEVQGLRTMEPTLEDLFLQLTGRHIRE
jgi:ABC-2 type transport system ATP-binding protein